MNLEGIDKTILWASTFLSRKGTRVTPEKQIVIGGTLGRKAEREAQKIRLIQLLFISGTTSTSAVIVSSLLEQLSNDTTAFLLKYGVGEITPVMHATQLQNLLQQMYKTDTPLPEPRNAFSHYVYCFGINRIWKILHARPTGSDNPFIALFLSCESASELTKSEFRGRSQNTRSLPKDLERQDESRLSEYVDGLPGTKSNGRPLQFELTEWQAWQLVTKFKSCLGRIQSTASMIKRLVQGRPDAEKPTVTVTNRLLLTGAVKLLAANMQILGWLVHHSSSFWKLLDSLEPVFTKRMAELRRMANDINGCNRDNEHPNFHSLAWYDPSTRATRMGGRSSEDEDVPVGADSVRSWLKQLTEYHHLLYDLSEGPRANGVIGGRVEINVHILPKIPQESLVSMDEILEALNETREGHAAGSKLGPLSGAHRLPASSRPV
ncbi:hypothetical protein FRC05_002184 [Tulasnella sp. 425]|nr:hypothetical protein FRC05_002184 [Tulasnella sp. 425]